MIICMQDRLLLLLIMHGRDDEDECLSCNKMKQEAFGCISRSRCLYLYTIITLLFDDEIDTDTQLIM